jgi:hypothetical protein
MTITEICHIVAAAAIVIMSGAGVYSVLTGTRHSRIEHQFLIQSMTEIHAELTQMGRSTDIDTGCPVCGTNGCPDCGESDRRTPPFGYSTN